MIHPKVAILIVSFAFSTAAMAVGSDSGTTPSNANCPMLSNEARSSNKRVDIARAQAALNPGSQKTVTTVNKVKK